MERRSPLVGRILVAAGVLQLAIVGALVLRSAQLDREQARRLETANPALPQPPGPIPLAAASRREAADRGMVGRLEVPRLRLSAPVVEGIGARALLTGVGRVTRTAFPGEADNVGIAGHRDSHFRRLKDIAAGDLIRVHTPDGVFWYRVDSTFVVRRHRGDLLNATGRPMLTLVTCYPFYWVGHAPERFIVRASLIS